MDNSWIHRLSKKALAIWKWAQCHGMWCHWCSNPIETHQRERRTTRQATKWTLSLWQNCQAFLWLAEPIWGSGQTVAFDCRLLILKGIIELQKGAFVLALVKKRWCWPMQVDGDAVAGCCKDKQVGTKATFCGTMEGTPFHIHALKEPDCIVSLMSSHGTLERSFLTMCSHHQRDHLSIASNRLVPVIVCENDCSTTK